MFRLSDKNLSYVYEAVVIVDYTNTHLGPLAAKDVPAVPVTGHESSLGFCNVGVVGNVFTPAGEGIAVAAQKIAGVAQSGGFMGEIIVLEHIVGLDPGNTGKLWVQGQGGQAIIGPVLIQ